MPSALCSDIATAVQHARARAGLVALTLLALGATAAEAADRLPAYDVDINASSVSGVSSGAYMAGQFHVAFSATVRGVGLIAGGPYYCAKGSLVRALNRCTSTLLGVPAASDLLAAARTLAREKAIDSLDNLAHTRAYIFSGTEDETVLPAVAQASRAFYQLAGVADANIVYVGDHAAGHGLITTDFGEACPATASPYLNDCDYDQAGAILEHIYGPLSPPATAPRGRLLEFDQSDFIDDPPSHSMNPVGYLFEPAACREGQRCRVHVVFHGCKQTTEHIGALFYQHAGFNEWADTNNIIVLYPQAWAGPGNPNGCWDWWGYDGGDYHTQTGRQMAAVMGMLRRLAGLGTQADYCQVYDSTNYVHWLRDRAESCYFWFACAVGSDENIGLMFALTRTRLFEHPRGHFSTRACRS